MTESDSRTIAKAIAGRFIERRDVLAKQIKNRNGEDMYFPNRQFNPESRMYNGPDIPVTLADLVAHVEGKVTYGHYLIDPTKVTCRIFAFDIDLVKGTGVQNKEPLVYHQHETDEGTPFFPREVWSAKEPRWIANYLGWELRALSEMLAERTKELLGIPVSVHYSGSKGVHVTGFLEPGTPAHDAREAALLVLRSLENAEVSPIQGENFWKCLMMAALHIEVFPKQDEVDKKNYGNLLRLPLGINQKSGKPSFFVDMSQPHSKWKQDDPMLVLEKGSLR